MQHTPGGGQISVAIFCVGFDLLEQRSGGGARRRLSWIIRCNVTSVDFKMPFLSWKGWQKSAV